MPKALANRLLHIEVEGSFTSWLNWAMKSGVNQKVIGFLSFRTDKLFGFDAKSDDLAFATPRSWEMVSNILNTVADDVNTVYPMVAGLVGTDTAIEFRTWCKVWNSLPSIEDVFDGKMPIVPNNCGILFVLVTTQSTNAVAHLWLFRRTYGSHPAVAKKQEVIT